MSSSCVRNVINRKITCETDKQNVKEDIYQYYGDCDTDLSQYYSWIETKKSIKYEKIEYQNEEMENRRIVIVQTSDNEYQIVICLESNDSSKTTKVKIIKTNKEPFVLVSDEELDKVIMGTKDGDSIDLFYLEENKITELLYYELESHPKTIKPRKPRKIDFQIENVNCTLIFEQLPDEHLKKDESFSSNIIVWFNGKSETISVKQISEEAIKDNVKKRERCIIPNYQREIPKRGYYMFQSLKYVEIPKSLRTIGAETFFWDKLLKNVEIKHPSSLTTIGERAFANCFSLETITLPKSLKELGEGAFEECTSLREVTILSSDATIGQDIFKGCTSLKVIYCSEEMKQKLKDLGYSEELISLIKPLEEKTKKRTRASTLKSSNLESLTELFSVNDTINTGANVENLSGKPKEKGTSLEKN